MRHPAKTVAALTCVAALAVGCSGGDKGDDASPKPGEKVTVTVATFNEFGYEGLIKEWNEANPDIQVEHKKAATSNEARDNMNTRLAAGSGLADIEAIEVDWLPELMQYPDKFEDLSSDEVKDRWLDWKTEAATVDGKLIGYGTDIGPEAVCYRADLFKKAGLPTDREEVAKLLDGDWDHYFDVGKQFVAKSGGVAWFDSAGATYQGMINQMEAPLENTDGTAKPLGDNAEIKSLYDRIIKASVDEKLSAGLAQWSEDWTNGFQNDKFATMLCPGWMLGVIEGNSEGVEGWDVANVFPGGGGNWGGSYLTVPSQGKHVEAAKKVAAWLTAPEQQAKAFAAKGTFPSQVKALEDPAVTDAKDPFFNDAPVGKIMADRAQAVTVTPYKGPNFFAITTVVTDALTRVDVDKTDDAQSSWDKALEAYGALGLS